MPGHSRGVIIENQDSRSSLVIHNIDQGRNTRMNKGRITYYAYHFGGKFFAASLLHAHGHTDTGAHTYTGIHSFQRTQSPQSITAYVTHDGHPTLAQDVENTAMRTTRAQ